MSKRVLRLAIIGGAVDSAVGYTHLIASQMDHHFELVSACFSRKAENNRATVTAWNLHHIRLYDTWLDLLDREKDQIDVVAILTPTPMHHEMVIRALSLGYPVICEKALASSYEEGLAICEAVESSKGFLAVTHNYTGYPMLRELKQQVEMGRLGKLTQIQIEMPQEGFARLDMQGNQPTPQAWRLKDGVIPSISLDLGAHLQHMIHFISGENPVSVMAEYNTFGFFKDIVDDVTAIARYPSGMKSVMWYSKSALGYRNGLRIRVFGSEGSAEWYQMEPEILVLHDVHGNRQWLDRASDVQLANQLRYNRFKSGHPAGFVEAFANLYVDIADKLEIFLDTAEYDHEWTYGVRQALISLSVMSFEQQSVKLSSRIDVEIS